MRTATMLLRIKQICMKILSSSFPSVLFVRSFVRSVGRHCDVFLVLFPNSAVEPPRCGGL